MLSESQQGGDFSPLVTGTSDHITSSAKKVLQTICSRQDASDSAPTCHTYEFWMTKISLSLQKSVASEATVRSK